MPYKLAYKITKKAYEEQEKEIYVLPMWVAQVAGGAEISFNDYYNRLKQEKEVGKKKILNRKRVQRMSNDDIIKQSQEILRLQEEQKQKK